MRIYLITSYPILLSTLPALAEHDGIEVSSLEVIHVTEFLESLINATPASSIPTPFPDKILNPRREKLPSSAFTGELS